MNKLDSVELKVQQAVEAFYEDAQLRKHLRQHKKAFEVIVQLQSQTRSKDFVQQCRQYTKRLVSNVAMIL